MDIVLEALEKYLTERHQTAVSLQEVEALGGGKTGAAALKQFGYGQPLLLTYQVGGEVKQEVLHRIRRTPFGRERDDDRVAAVWLDFQTFNELPRHVAAVDLVVQTHSGGLQSIRSARELLLLTTFQPGMLYADDLARLRDEGQAQPEDLKRAGHLAAYLAKIHRVQHDDPALWCRRLRDLVGHGEGIMGLTDSYPQGLDYAPAELLQAIEQAANFWRWRLKPKSHRLAQVHGDFHPFNIVFTPDGQFFVLDRSRGAWGEPADDVSCLSLNYLFFSLQRSGNLAPPFLALHDRFWEKYLAARPDNELTAVIQPWFAWRALVLASPLWYPTIANEIRRKLFNFARRVLHVKRYNYIEVNRYFEAV